MLDEIIYFSMFLFRGDYLILPFPSLTVFKDSLVVLKLRFIELNLT